MESQENQEQGEDLREEEVAQDDKLQDGAVEESEQETLNG